MSAAVIISGWLGKKSGSSFISSYQRRFVVVKRDLILKYYKNEQPLADGGGGGADVEQGAVNLYDAEFIRASDARRFEIKIKQGERVFVFEAENREKMLNWVSTLEQARASGSTKARTSIKPNMLSPPLVGGREGEAISGWLFKQSNSSLVFALQKRFVVIRQGDSSDGFLRYYKRESDTEERGKCCLYKAQVKLLESNPCRFEVSEATGRKYMFEANTEEDANVWITNIGIAVASATSAPTPPNEKANDEANASSSSTLTSKMATRSPSIVGSILSHLPGGVGGGGGGGGESKPAVSRGEVWKEGWLLKQSHNKYVRSLHKYQDRYVVVTKGDNKLRYYRSDTDTEDLSENKCDLGKIDFIRRYDDTPTCTVFEIGQVDRVYAFDASSSENMQAWISALQEVRDSITLSKEKQKIEETPERIRFYDENGQQAYLAALKSDLDLIYPPPNNNSFSSVTTSITSAASAIASPPPQQKRLNFLAPPSFPLIDLAPTPTSFDEELTVHEHNLRIASMRKYLQCILADVQTLSQIRHEVLQCSLDLFNEHLTERLEQSVLCPHSSALEECKPGDVFGLIRLLSEHQEHLEGIYCPVERVSTSTSAREGPQKNKKGSILVISFECKATESIPKLCKRYVEGSDLEHGAAHQISTHCQAMWTNLIANPREHIEKHSDGSFYTYLPTDVWQVLNMHLALTIEANSEYLHVWIAEKIGEALIQLVEKMEIFVKSFGEGAAPDGLEDIELELLCAFANDCGFSIESVVSVVERFESDEIIRERVNSSFDPVTDKLVRAGNECLDQLVHLVLSDVQPHLDAVFTNRWLLQGQNSGAEAETVNVVEVAVATITDYLHDFHEYLLVFWLKKFVHALLEELIIRYCFAILSKNSSPLPELTEVEEAEGGFLRPSMHIEGVCICDEDAFGRISHDVNALNGFFQQQLISQHLEDGESLEIFSIVNELVLLFQLPALKAAVHTISRISAFPSAAREIYKVFDCCMHMREDVDEEEREDCELILEPALNSAQEAAEFANENGYFEDGQLAHLYTQLANRLSFKEEQEKNKSAGGGGKAGYGAGRQSAQNHKFVDGSMAQRLRDFANLPMQFLRSAIKDKLDQKDCDEWDKETMADGGGDGEAEKNKSRISHLSRDSVMSRDTIISKRRAALKDNKIDEEEKDPLLKDVQAYMIQKREIDARRHKIEEEDRERERKLKHKIHDGIIKIESHLDKQCPQFGRGIIWQNRYFKIDSRQSAATVTGSEQLLKYVLLWYKKRGGSLANSLDLSQLKSIYVLETARALAFNCTTNTLILMSEKESATKSGEKCDDEFVDVYPCTGTAKKSEASAEGSSFCFVLVPNQGHDVVLRGSTVDKLIRWCNAIIQATQMKYNFDTGRWDDMCLVREAR